MKLTIQISNIQHVRSMVVDFDLSLCKLTCVVGRNGVGKTTLVKAMQNLRFADTFAQTSPTSIFGENSKLTYITDENKYSFHYDPDLRTLNSKDIIPEKIKTSVDAELPMPYGQRFNFFQSIVSADLEIRRSIVLEIYEHPEELINMLNGIYSTSRFDKLVEIKIKKSYYYCVLLEDSKYIREDHLSSGEFFLISLYRKIKGGSKLIIIDEIDISLDAAAQTKLAEKLRVFCQKYSVNIFFTTHSLPLMKTLEYGELFHLEETDGILSPATVSYNFIKSLLFGFEGWDKYILTEDEVLQRFLEFIINKFCSKIFYRFKIIYIGGAHNVVNLMKRNAAERFLTTEDNVISILDGDQADQKHVINYKNVHCIPFNSVEKKIYEDYLAGSEDLVKISNGIKFRDNKDMFSKLTGKKLMSESQIFEYLCNAYVNEITEFSEKLKSFLYDPIDSEIQFRIK
ncbi:ATP-binding protein [Pseudomonas fuscovaginae UPB0736]|uniref:AAA family ATPase n=1 Tax=Pseudomonas asplenii TaxID=53407 RepID=UPI000315AA6A|nr:AAA family ATPase [Pseudomonas fuscovaginae]UUQ67616.1 ATP-binding protein [Pseudomonas fuscovaginae UPB0736]